MSQANIVIVNGSGLVVRTAINNALQAITSNFRGPGEPNPAYAGMLWEDTTNMLVKQRNANNNGWITVGTLDAVNWGLLSSGEVATTPTPNKVLRMNAQGELPTNITGSSASCVGNAASSTKLKTSRKISGVDFDGTKDISIPIIPTGGIIMWSGSIESIPSGWALCNGANGTPNLMDKFIVGAGSGYGVGATGGEASHVLTTEELPPHNHALNVMGSTDADNNHTVANEFQTGPDGFCGWKYTQNTGSGWGHENRPPYYALAYIMRL